MYSRISHIAILQADFNIAYTKYLNMRTLDYKIKLTRPKNKNNYLGSQHPHHPSLLR